MLAEYISIHAAKYTGRLSPGSRSVLERLESHGDSCFFRLTSNELWLVLDIMERIGKSQKVKNFIYHSWLDAGNTESAQIERDMCVTPMRQWYPLDRLEALVRQDICQHSVLSQKVRVPCNEARTVFSTIDTHAIIIDGYGELSTDINACIASGLQGVKQYCYDIIAYLNIVTNGDEWLLPYLEKDTYYGSALLDLLCRTAGPDNTRTALAPRLGVTRGRVGQMINSPKPISLERVLKALQIESHEQRLACGKILEFFFSHANIYKVFYRTESVQRFLSALPPPINNGK